MRAILCSFSGGLDGMRRADQKDSVKVLLVLAARPRFTAFEATANDDIARTLTRLKREDLIDYPQPQPGYPWCLVKLTERGLAAIEPKTTTEGKDQ